MSLLLTKGFTLIELLVTTILLSILLLITIPAFQHIVAYNRATTAVNQIVTALNYARSEAIQRDVEITFCKSADHQTCGGNWQQGQIVVANHQVLRIYPALPANTQFYLKSNFSNNDAIRWLPNGATAGQNGSFYYCPPDMHYARRIVLEKTGRVRVEQNNVICNDRIKLKNS
jgi:type IV fimbrial biogenesis protein FimT